jgi:hypothetical protein
VLRYFKFHRGLPGPAPARESYGPRLRGRGWPDQCPPIRAANAFGWDVPAAFDMTFRRRRDGGFALEDPVDVQGDWAWAPRGVPAEDAVPIVQRNAWFWDRGQKVPHVISPHVYARLRNQVKVSTFLYLWTDPGEMLLMTEVPNRRAPFRAFTALLDTDWYPASYPWHCVLELAASEREIRIAQGTPLCRLLIVRRRSYAAVEAPEAAFDRFFAKGQRWLARHAKGPPSEMMDITGAYARQQRKARFSVR